MPFPRALLGKRPPRGPSPPGSPRASMTRLKPREATYARPPETPEGSVVSVFRVPPEVAGQRLDVFLHAELRRTSRTRAQEIIALSAFGADGRKLRSNHRVRAEELVLLWRAPWDEVAVPRDVPVVHEDAHLFAVDKPAGLPVHPTARYYKNTLITILRETRDDPFMSLGHRLDRETSGVLVVARSPECDRLLKKKFEARDGVDKHYLALTWGVPEGLREGEEIRVEAPLELDPTHSTRVKMRLGQTREALHAATRFELLARRTRDDGRAYGLVRCSLETGRQHQIRVHLAAVCGAPIVGDKLYGPDEGCFARGADGELTPEDERLLELPRHALHAAELALDHPMTGERVRMQAPLPADLATFWASLAPA